MELEDRLLTDPEPVTQTCDTNVNTKVHRSIVQPVVNIYFNLCLNFTPLLFYIYDYSKNV